MNVKLWIICILLLSCSAASAQEESQSAQSPPRSKLQADIATKDLERGNITVDFKDADIHDVLKIISYKSGVNIVAGKDVTGLVGIRLVNVPWERALDVILKNNGFVYERDKDIIRVTTVENLSKEELATEIFILNYAKAQAISEAIREILSDRGKIKFDQRTNQVVVTDVPANLYKISKVIEKLDKRTLQVMIEIKIIETVLDDDEKLGIDWTLQSSVTGAARPFTGPFAFGKTYGKTGKEYFPKVDTSTSDFTGSEEQGFPYAVKSDFTFGTLSFAQLQAALEILKSRSDAKTLSNPKIVTLNNKEAIIHVGEDYNIPLYERNTSTGQMEITGYQAQKIGVKLTVTPYINDQQEIVVDLHPEVSSFLRFDDYGNVKAPVFSTRETTTQIMIKDGETIAIGGLIKERTVDYVKKVPLLGDLPLLKYIFSKTTKTVDTTDLMIFVTVRLLDSQAHQQAKISEE
ncbi:MAG: secretin and TonB N-terminal domain-containing protein [Candidatus Omnitrophica bacterium]|nr:secretin and TonB N-terminal domain-containing protein [Candidatus Omnitrophota bacterium]